MRPSPETLRSRAVVVFSSVARTGSRGQRTRIDIDFRVVAQRTIAAMASAARVARADAMRMEKA
jgi:hypothetical protein